MNHQTRPCWLIASLPRSGSTWLYNCVRACIGERGCCREFFNPFLNDRYSDVLRTNFGADSSTRHLGDDYPSDHLRSLNTVINIFRYAITDDDIRKDVTNTWFLENYELTKEVWILQRLRVMKSIFKIVGLSRATEHTFPGSFPPLNEYLYLRLYESLLHNFADLEESQKRCLRFMLENCRSNESKICGTHLFCMELLKRNCCAENISVIKYEDLICLDETSIARLVADSWPLFASSSELAKIIVETRESRDFLESRSKEFFRIVDRSFFQDLRALVDDYMQGFSKGHCGDVRETVEDSIDE